MTRENGRRQWLRDGVEAPRASTRRHASSPAVESLEERQLLSFYAGPTASRPVIVGKSYFNVAVTGGGFETVRQLPRGGGLAITLLGTNPNSVLSITASTTHTHYIGGGPLSIGQINVKTGLLGGIQAPAANFNGTTTPISSALATLQFNALGPKAKLNLPGNVGAITIGAVNLGPNGSLHIGGSVTSTSSLGAVALDGGQVKIDGSVTAPLTLGPVTLQRGGQIAIGGSVPGGLNLSGTTTATTNGQLTVGGSVTGLTAGAINLGSNGLIHVSGGLTGTTTLGALTLDGGQVELDGDVTGPVTLAGLSVLDGGQFLVGHDLTGGLTVSGGLSAASGGKVSIGHNLGAFSVGQALTLDGGQFVVGNDATGAGTVGGGMVLAHNGLFSIGRDFSGGLTVNGDLTLDSGASLAVARDLSSLTVNGNVKFTPTAGQIAIGGNLNSFTISGYYQGKGSTTATDLTVGLNLGAFNVTGGGSNQGGVRGANIAVGKSILDLNVLHGLFTSLITAGVLIDGTPHSGAGGGNLGADGVDAIYDSELRAGQEIRNFTINGDVRSDFVANPNAAGYRTRIIAGEDRQGKYTSGGLIDNFQITGALIDSVLAASVAPYGGNGTLPNANSYGPPPTVANTPGDLGSNTYDKPAGTIAGGTVGNPVNYPNYSEVSYYNEMPTGVAYDSKTDRTIDDAILPGAINPSYASPPLTQSALSNATTVTSTANSGTTQNNSGSTSTTTVTPSQQPLPLPTKSTVLGGVISTNLSDANDYAGIFAADTRGVFVGNLPK